MSAVIGMWARHGAFSQGYWRTIGTLPTPLHSSGVAAAGRTIYVFGGRTMTGSHTFVSTFYAIDIYTGLVTLIAGAPTITGTRSYGMWAVAYLGDLYFGTGTATVVWRYSPSAGTWTQMASMPTAAGHGGAAVVGNGFYVASGYFPSGTSPNTEVNVVGWYYSPSANSWSALPVSSGTSFSMPSVPDGLNFVASRPILAEHDGKLLICSGRIPTTTGHTMREYNPTTGLTSVLSRLPGTAAAGGRWAHGGKTPSGLVISGGAEAIFSWSGGRDTSTALAGTFHFSRALNAWTVSTGLLPTPVGQAGYTVHNLRLYAVGGVTAGATPTAAIQEYAL